MFLLAIACAPNAMEKASGPGMSYPALYYVQKVALTTVENDDIVFVGVVLK